VDIIRVQRVRFAFKVELAIVIDDHGEAITIEVVVLEANEAVVLEANKAVVLEANDAIVLENNDAVVLKTNEAVIFEANEDVVFEDWTHCFLFQRCGRETRARPAQGLFGR
jgi:hypothetical protein